LGVPDHPEAWLLTAPRRRLIDGARRARVRDDAAKFLQLLAEGPQETVAIPDGRLKLLFVCAHPAMT
jgi:RNA polymerase sigma-70 factor (ECF subfamily)